MIHIRFRDTNENVGIPPGKLENSRPIASLSVPAGFRVTFIDGGWKSYPFYEGVYEMYLQSVPEAPAGIEVERVGSARFVTIRVAKYVVRNKLGLIQSVTSTKQGRPIVRATDELVIDTEYAEQKLPVRERAYFGFDDFPDNDIDQLDIPDGLAVHCFHKHGNPDNVYKRDKRDNPYKEYTGFVDLRARSMGNHVSALRVGLAEKFKEEKQQEEEARIEGTILSMAPVVKDDKGNPTARIMSYATKDWDFGKVEEDWTKWVRCADDLFDGLMLSARNGALIVGHIARDGRKFFYHGGKPRGETDTSYRPPITIEKKDGSRIEIEGYTDVVYHQVEPLRGIYYLYDWIEWIDSEGVQMGAVNTADIKRLWRK